MILKNRVQKQFDDKTSVWKFQTSRSLLIANPVHAVDRLASARGVPMKSKLTIFAINLIGIFASSGVGETGTVQFSGWIYEGELLNGVPHGHGDWNFDLGDIFEGECWRMKS